MDPLTPNTLLRRRWTNEDEDRAEAEAIKQEQLYYDSLDAAYDAMEERYAEHDPDPLLDDRGSLFPRSADPECFGAHRLDRGSAA